MWMQEEENRKRWSEKWNPISTIFLSKPWAMHQTSTPIKSFQGRYTYNQWAVAAPMVTIFSDPIIRTRRTTPFETPTHISVTVQKTIIATGLQHEIDCLVGFSGTALDASFDYFWGNHISRISLYSKFIVVIKKRRTDMGLGWICTTCVGISFAQTAIEEP